jgi:putative ABC transport system ATP-binding protein
MIQPGTGNPSAAALGVLATTANANVLSVTTRTRRAISSPPGGCGGNTAADRVQVPRDNRGVLFELERVTQSRDNKVVLQDLTASLPKGASCVAGPSGSGKSTLLRLLNRLADPDSGTVRYEGVDVRDRDPLELRQEVCLVPQLPALLDGTVEDNVHFAARLAGREPEVPRLLDLAGLDASFAGRSGEKLSVGEQQRAMLARALAMEPRVLLLDEPTSALDGDARGAVEATLLDLRQRVNVSTVLVTHDLDQARRMADWVVRLDEGRLVAEGRVVEHLPV